MPGTPLDLEYPETGDTVTQALTKLSNSIETIETDLEAKVVPGELDMTSALDMKGNDVLNIGVLELDDTATATGADPGSIVYAGGEFILVTGDGEIALTAGGTIDVSTTGGWSGFGSGVSGAYSGGVFNVYEAASDYGTHAAQGIRLENGNSGSTYVTLNADATVAGTTSYSFADRANGSTGLLQVTSAGKVTGETTLSGNLTFSGANTISGINTFSATPIFSTGATVNDDLTLGASCQVQIGSAYNTKLIYTGRTVAIPIVNVDLYNGSIEGVGAAGDYIYSGVIASAGTTDIAGAFSFTLDYNEIPTAFSAYCRGTGLLEKYTIDLYSIVGVTPTLTMTATGNLSNGFSSKTAAVSDEEIQGATNRYVVKFYFGDDAGDGTTIASGCGMYAFSVTTKKTS